MGAVCKAAKKVRYDLNLCHSLEGSELAVVEEHVTVVVLYVLLWGWQG